MTSPSNAELREAIETELMEHGAYPQNEDFVRSLLDALIKLFQAREQQLYKAIIGDQPYMTPDGKRSEKEMLISAAQNKVLTELLGELPKKHAVQDDEDLEDELTGKALKHEIQENNINYGFNAALDQVVSVIERLQNKTNDGGQNGGL